MSQTMNNRKKYDDSVLVDFTKLVLDTRKVPKLGLFPIYPVGWIISKTLKDKVEATGLP